MTTAYTSLLGLALPVTGELQGTWGDVVNNEITSLLDTAVAGTTTLNTDADVTLTTTTGGSNQARQAIILWTANGSVTRNITAPASSKSYVVINKSAGTQSIVLRGVGPTTGVTILKDEQAVVAWNGSDFVKVSTFGGNATLNSLTLSGGTANGVLYLNGSKVATSGSALVFDGTNLGLGGTPNTYSGYTAMTLNSSVNGPILDLNYAGTRQGTFLALTNEVRVGSIANIPFTFYQNGSEQMRLTSTGLGIGTSSPGAKLDVVGTTRVTRSGAASQFADLVCAASTGFNINVSAASGALTMSTDGGTTAMVTLGGTGNLGIGTSSPATKLHVNTVAAGYGITVAANSQTSITYQLGIDSNSNLAFYDTNAAAQRLVLSTSGNLGIGTSSPSAKLDVVGDIAISGGSNLRVASVTNSSLGLSGGNSFNTGGASIALRGSTAAFNGNGMEFYAGGSERARIDSSGNLGIGTSSIFGILNLQTGTNARIEFASASTVGTLEILNNARNAYLDYDVYASVHRWRKLGSVAMTLDSSGNLGLGVTPSAWYSDYKVIQVGLAGSVFNDNYNEDLSVGSNAYADTRGGYKFIRTGYAQRYVQTNGGQHRWFTSTASGTAGNTISFTQAMTLDASGNLGIGTTSPSNRLSVAGSTGTIASFTNGATADFSIICGSSITSLNAGGANILAFQTGSTERARITSGGNLLVGKTADDQTTVGIQLVATGGITLARDSVSNCVNINKKSNVGDLLAFYYNDATVVGTITNTSTNTAYNTSSDYRLKDNQQPLTGSGAFIDALQPKTWNWTIDGSKGVGFIAHEVQAVSPGSVVGEKDAVDADGKPVMQAMEYGSAEFIANIVAELQSLRARVAALEA